MGNVRGLRHLPWPVRIAVTSPVAAILIFFQYQTWTAQRDFDAWQTEGQHHAHRAEHAPRARPAPRNADMATHTYHDPDAYYPSEHIDQGNDHIGVWTAVAAGGAGLSVLLAALGMFSLFGGSRKDEEPSAGPEHLVPESDNPFA